MQSWNESWRKLPPAAQARLAELELLRRMRQNPLKWIIPPGRRTPQKFRWTPKQIEAEAGSRGKKLFLFGAGNRVGKTEWAVRRMLGLGLSLDPLTLHELPQDPLCWRLGPPKLLWCITVTKDVSREVQQKYLWERLPRCLVRRGCEYHERSGFHNNVLVLRNGTRFVFKSGEQELSTFEGNPIHGAWIDEFIPLPYLTATVVRTTDYRGPILWTTWPSAPELKDIFVDRRMPGGVELSPEDVGAVFGGMADNPYLSPAEIKLVQSLLDPAEVPGRIFGQFAFTSGLVYGDFHERLHVENVEFPVPWDWTRYEIIDPGWDNPCAVLFGGVDEYGGLHCYDEIYERRRTVGEIAAMIYLRRWEHRGLMTPDELERYERLTRRTAADPQRPPTLEEELARNKQLKAVIDEWRALKGDCAPRMVLIDEASGQRDQAKQVPVRKIFSEFGIHARTASNADKTAQRRQVREKLRPLDGIVRLKVGYRLKSMRFEFSHHRLARPDEETGEYLDDVERVVKAHNHLLSCLEYWIDAKPAWEPPEAQRPPSGTVLARHAELAQREEEQGRWRRRG